MEHRKRTTQIILAAMVIATLAMGAGAADMFVVDGKIQSVDPDTKTLTVKQRKGGEVVTVKDESKKTKYRTYTKGTMDDVTEGANLKVYGKVQPDISAVDDVYSICVMPSASNSTNKKSRIDGKLAIEDGKWYLQRKDGKVPMTLKDKPSISVVYDTDFGLLEKGMRIRFGANAKDDYYVPIWSIRGYAPREKTQAYVENMKKDK